MNEELAGDPFFVQPFPRGSFITLMDLAVAGTKSVRFTTKYTPSQTGKHYLGFSSMGSGRMFIDDVLVSEQKHPTKDSMAFLLGTQAEDNFQFPFKASQSYAIRIETLVPSYCNGELYLLDGQLSVHLGFISEEEMEQDLLAEAIFTRSRG